MSRSATMGRVVATGVFLGLIVAVPLLEAVRGVGPGVGAGDALDLRALLNGRWAEAVERELNEGSTVARDTRPAWHALKFRAFREAPSKVAVGEDDWLFLASTVQNYPPRRAAEFQRGILDQIQELQRWFEQQGTALYLLVVPNKASVHPEKLGAVRPRVRSAYPELFAEIETRGLWSDDFLSLLRPAEGEAPAYFAYDSHWTPEAAERAVQRVAERIRERSAEQGTPLPGRPVDGRVQVEDAEDFVGGTVKMLDVGTWFGLDRHFVERSRPRRGVGPDGEELSSEGPEPLVWLGTSFSEGYRTASLLSAELGRAVEDRSLFGLGPTKAIVDLARSIRRGERPAPEILVWEFPERYVYTSPAQMQETLRSALASLDYDPDSARPLPVAERRVERLSITREEDGVLEGVAEPSDPRLEYGLITALAADGTSALSFEITTSRFAAVRVWLDRGEGWPETHDEQGLIPRKNAVQRIMIPLEGGGAIRAVRLDVVTERRQRAGPPVRLRLGPLEVWSR